jgi:hypothetical protein
MDDWFLETEVIQDDELRAFVERVRVGAGNWEELGVNRTSTQTWVYQADPADPWIMLSLDFLDGSGISGTLRLDVDAHGVRGGWSPASLNWDEGVRAMAAEVDFAPPEGIRVDAAIDTRNGLSDLAIAWFEGRLKRHPQRR